MMISHSSPTHPMPGLGGAGEDKIMIKSGSQTSSFASDPKGLEMIYCKAKLT